MTLQPRTPWPCEAHEQVLDDVALELIDGMEETMAALVLVGTLAEIEDGEYNPDDCMEAVVSTAFTAAEMRVLGNACITLADRMDGAQ